MRQTRSDASDTSGRAAEPAAVEETAAANRQPAPARSLPAPRPRGATGPPAQDAGEPHPHGVPGPGPLTAGQAPEDGAGSPAAAGHGRATTAVPRTGAARVPSTSAAARGAAEERLAEALRTGPFPVALRAALAARGLALHRVRHRLAQRGVHVGVTSLSYWQRGVRRPDRPESLRAVSALEEILDLPEHALTRLLGPRGPVDHPTARPYRTLIGPGSALEAVLAELEAPKDGGLHTVLQIERVEIDRERRLAAREAQHVVRAHREGIDRYVAIHCGEPGSDTAGVRVLGLENCRTGRVRRAAEAGVVVAELLFDTRLASGDTAMLRYRFEDGTGEPSREYFRGFTYAGGQLRAPGLLRPGPAAGALPPLRPALGAGAARVRCRPDAQRVRLGAPRGPRHPARSPGRGMGLGLTAPDAEGTGRCRAGCPWRSSAQVTRPGPDIGRHCPSESLLAKGMTVRAPA